MKAKPTPPIDLWEQLDAINSKMEDGIVKRGFTVEEFQERYSIRRAVAESRMRKMVEAKQIQYIGKKVSTRGRLAKAYDLCS